MAPIVSLFNRLYFSVYDFIHLSLPRSLYIYFLLSFCDMTPIYQAIDLFGCLSLYISFFLSLSHAAFLFLNFQFQLLFVELY